MRRRRLIDAPTLFLLCCFAGASAEAQAPDQPTPAASPAVKPPETLAAYDVSSVRVNTSGSGGWSWNSNPSGIVMDNVPLVPLLKNAYEMNAATDDQIVGLPAWAKNQHFDISAKVSPDEVTAYKKLDDKQRDAMLQALLKERFKLSTHFETKQGNVYALQIGKQGSKLTKGDVGAGRSADETHKNGSPGPGGMVFNNSHLQANGIAIEALVNFLTQQTQRTVIDQTGLTGNYSYTLDWTPTDQAGQADTSSPELFTALQEQLGLKLEAQKGPLRELIIDHIESPSAN